MDMKNYRAPSRPWRWIIGAALTVAFTCIVGPMDFADRLQIQAENKLMRVELATLKKTQARIAPIRCINKKRPDHIAMQPDGGDWRVHCRDGFITAVLR